MKPFLSDLFVNPSRLSYKGELESYTGNNKNIVKSYLKNSSGIKLVPSLQPHICFNSLWSFSAIFGVFSSWMVSIKYFPTDHLPRFSVSVNALCWGSRWKIQLKLHNCEHLPSLHVCWSSKNRKKLTNYWLVCKKLSNNQDMTCQFLLIYRHWISNDRF